MTDKFDSATFGELQPYTGLREAAWLWDTSLGQIIWANTPGLTFWNEHDVSRLGRRHFDHAMPGLAKVLELSAEDLPEEGIIDDFLFWTEKGPRNIECRCRRLSMKNGTSGTLLVAVAIEETEPQDEFPVDLADQTISEEGDPDTTFENSLASPEDQATLKEIAKLLSAPDDDDTGLEESESDEDAIEAVSTENGSIAAYTNGAIPPSEIHLSSVQTIEEERAKAPLPPLTNGHMDRDQPSFFAKIGHEVRTPLNSIIGFAELMKEERFGELGHQKYRSYINDILESAQHAVSLVNDLLDLSKVESGQFVMAPVALDLNNIIENCISSLQPQTGQARLVIRQSLAANLPKIHTDRRSLRQIILNLLSNAIKFTSAGGQIIVSSQLLNDNKVRLRVRDTGMGMSEEDLATAMEPFTQLANGENGSLGTGLGLPLTKALTEANHAEFFISSTEGKGTLVEICFPIELENRDNWQ
ncbi:MAG: sensor histidine kinase [Methyloligellaceae bacterium]